MKKKLLVLFGIAVLSLLLTNSAAAQNKNIKVVKGKKLVLKGEASDQKDRTYFFKAKIRSINNHQTDRQGCGF